MQRGVLAITFVALAALRLGVLGCSEPPPLSSTDASVLDLGPSQSRGDGGVVGALPDIDLPGSCDPAAPMNIWVDVGSDGLPSRIHVPVLADGKRGVLLFDTGSETTFITTPSGTHDPIVDGGVLSLGGCERQAMGRPFAAESKRGWPGVGFLGTEDLMVAPRAKIDLTAGTFTRIFDQGPSTDGWRATSMEIIRGSMLVRIKLDAISVRLLVDTGSADILWLGQGQKLGDSETQTTDAQGNVVRLFAGMVSAEITPGVVESLPVVRAPSFPYFEQRVRDLGGDVQGLLGLSALGTRQVVFDIEGKMLHRQPK